MLELAVWKVKLQQKHVPEGDEDERVERCISCCADVQRAAVCSAVYYKESCDVGVQPHKMIGD